MVRFDDIVEKVSSYISEKEVAALRKAYVFAGQAHKGQVRRSGEPYLSHPLEVTNFLADMRLDKTTLVAALLHDVLEDTDTTAAALRESFGREAAALVEGVTKISRVQEVSPEVRRAETLRKIILAMTDDIRVIFIKLADRIHNLKTLGFLDEEKQRQVARETLDIYAPIANRLGMGRIRAELEDLSFRYVAPEEFAKIAAIVEPQHQAAEADLAAMKRTLEQLLAANGLPAEVYSRIKRPYSVWSKMKRRDIGFDEVFDFLALRVITASVKDCYSILGIIHQRWPHLPQRFRDFIAMPKPNLYQALHTTVITEGKQTFEIQIRTRDMHDLAENGIAAHWRYKDDAPPSPMVEDRRLHWLREMAALFEEKKNPQEFLSALKSNLVPEEVYVFTPKGKVVNLPSGATALDFAFKIHTEIGLHAAGARVNGSPAALKTVLRTGDIVEILTEPGKAPTRGLLAAAATSGARQALRRALDVKSRATSAALGRKLWEKELRKYSIPAELRREEETARRLEAVLGPKASSPEEFYRLVGLGRIVADARLVEAVFGPVAPRRPGLLDKAAARLALGPDSAVRLKDIDGQMIKLARCCAPVKGEPVVGYLSAGRGLTVHSLRCPLVKREMLDGQRLVEVSWDPALAGTFKARLMVKSQDTPGVLAKVAAAVAGLDGDISRAEATTIAEGRARIRLDLKIRDIRHLEAITGRILGLREVLSVERV
ncbi:MAG TPA: bifunctional (p)ppGpp synthetase/guanosine-3',5'-bis(diphosphate) 3'-pyrophosphohydrolase [Candidatus Aminicenantes bacterium]|nr:bifunctional (p)ppGpp synthetase/guanosine-3',5'-bis(diphosphate) 3'-pyrophosphohydrolase [Candidatus Aminicenantes bacterium]HRY64170.1 bifunctional (p)ppGpp synthetase/guanosine-3',5'-bis(diphosphate) 3'-pyrophosphohydrolase [Candidatus Aminicenantes bacterium]HRZ71083.1 bifunctional (p)ppGpp synthetase/guanosine-3',5'-bis(diphosphate) 3'-pyrophosphohydrolase [Candidatus Aminicenantes bacterium]